MLQKHSESCLVLLVTWVKYEAISQPSQAPIISLSSGNNPINKHSTDAMFINTPHHMLGSGLFTGMKQHTYKHQKP